MPSDSPTDQAASLFMLKVGIVATVPLTHSLTHRKSKKEIKRSFGLPPAHPPPWREIPLHQYLPSHLSTRKPNFNDPRRRRRRRRQRNYYIIKLCNGTSHNRTTRPPQHPHLTHNPPRAPPDSPSRPNRSLRARTAVRNQRIGIISPSRISPFQMETPQSSTMQPIRSFNFQSAARRHSTIDCVCHQFEMGA